MKICRFCQEQALEDLFLPTKIKNKITASEFSCTNCGFGQHGLIVRCRSCGMVYVDEKISQKQISTYYEVADDPLYFAEQPARKRTFMSYLRRMEKRYPRRGKLLDVGTNTGLFVRLAKDDGWEATGLEPNRWAVEYAKENYDLSLINKPFEKGVFPKESFDVITMWDVIEHFNDPITEMKNVYWYLKPGGMFVFSTTDPDSLMAKLMGTKWPWYMEMHRAFLSTTAAKRYLLNSGFKRVFFRPHFRFLSVGYLATRLVAISPKLAYASGKMIEKAGVSKLTVPFYANDVYDCYAFK